MFAIYIGSGGFEAIPLLLNARGGGGGGGGARGDFEERRGDCPTQRATSQHHAREGRIRDEIPATFAGNVVATATNLKRHH